MKDHQPIDGDLLRICQRAMEFAAGQVRHTVEAYPDFFPMYTLGGRWRHGKESWTHWCEGFLGGQLWIIYGFTNDPWWRGQAEHYCRLMEHRKDDAHVHDLGFLFWPTWKRWYDLTGDRSKMDVVVHAGRTLGTRFMEKGQYLRSFVGDSSTFIDIMMNTGIIFDAARATHDKQLWNHAVQHCLTSRRYLVRGDGSTAHEGIFDTGSGEFLRQSTHQGWRSDSCWARGQSWALYGFGNAYAKTRDPRFLETAEACADYYIAHTPQHGIPPNDWDEPNPRVPFESSAAAIAASGMMRLAELTGDTLRASCYRNYALKLLQRLASPDFLAEGTPGWEGVLKHGIYHQGRGLGVDESVAWGDYFFLEALSSVLSCDVANTSSD